jgi:hypothetical protein
MGASARYGREATGPHGEILPSLVYSTELARSVKLAYAASVRVQVGEEANGSPKVETVKPGNTEI